jgi:hypothetical protein
MGWHKREEDVWGKKESSSDDWSQTACDTSLDNDGFQKPGYI